MMHEPPDGQNCCPLALAARRWGGAPFLRGASGSCRSFAETDARALRMASALVSQGVVPGETVGIIPACPEEPLSWLPALWRTGVSVVVADPKAPVAYTLARFQSVNVRHVLGGEGEFTALAARAGMGPLDPEGAAGDGEPFAWRTGDARLLGFTSGTSGAPKAAAHTVRTACAAAGAAANALALAPGDRYLLTLPMHHVSGLSVLFRCLASGAVCVLPDPALTLAENITLSPVTHVSLVAAQLYRLLEEPAAVEALRRTKAVLLGGGPAPEALLARALGEGVPLMNSYGMTETGAMVCATRPGAGLAELRTAGKPLVKNTLRLSAEGRIEMRGEFLFEGYYDNGVVMPPPADGGWFRTGDLGEWDEEGRLVVTGRADRMFISGGENIQPEAVETLLLGLEGVRRAAVVPVPDPVYGSVPAVFLDLEPGAVWDAVALREVLGGRLPRFAVPRLVLPWAAGADSGIKPPLQKLIQIAEAWRSREG